MVYWTQIRKDGAEKMVTGTEFGVTSDGERVSLYRIENRSGAHVELLDYGCIVRSIVVPSGGDALTDVCLGHDTVAAYEQDGAHHGAAIGRVANRISGARFLLDGKEYTLAKNDGENCLHGGVRGFDRRVWELADKQEDSVTFRRLSPDGEEGFPGNLTAEIRYTFTEDNELSVEYAAQSDADTPLNLTNHTYFNLDGPRSENALGHVLSINASFITQQGPGLIPTGRMLAVDADVFDRNNGTPFDFSEPKAVGRDIGADCEQLHIAGGYDHNFVLDGSGFREAALLRSPASGIGMYVFTDCPCAQFYSGNFLDGRIGKGGRAHKQHAGLCFETGGYPDAVNRPEFPPCILKKGESFASKTLYAFSAEEN
ncbi:MAG: aldose epimerase family protein [Oscillospiraceae bacterium]|nr:aldose epimerase family protein [Oscillospiraceae bacterium]